MGVIVLSSAVSCFKLHTGLQLEDVAKKGEREKWSSHSLRSEVPFI
jgi:hypothetical protein